MTPAFTMERGFPRANLFDPAVHKLDGPWVRILASQTVSRIHTVDGPVAAPAFARDIADRAFHIRPAWQIELRATDIGHRAAAIHRPIDREIVLAGRIAFAGLTTAPGAIARIDS